MTVDEKLQYYINLPYPIEIVEDDGAVVASIPDLPGCNAFGDNVQDALRSLRETKELWLKGQIESDQPIPGPSTAEEYSGKFVLRIPKELHRILNREAQRQGISLNQYVAYLLADRHRIASLCESRRVPAWGRRAKSDMSRVKSHGSSHSYVGIDDRSRNEAGEIRHKRSDTLVKTLREEYGEDFARGFRGDATLGTVLERTGADSLSEYLKKKK